MRRFNIGDKVQIIADLTIGNPIGVIQEIATNIDSLEEAFKVVIDDQTTIKPAYWVMEYEIRKIGELGISDLLIDLAYYGGTWDGWEYYNGLYDEWYACTSMENPFSGLTFRRSDFPSATYSNNFK